MTSGSISSAGARKLRTVFLSVIYSLSGQLSNIILSALTVYFISAEFWGQYSRILLSVAFFQVLCSWGNREYLSMRHNAGFRKALLNNMLSRLPLLLLSLLMIGFVFHQYALAASLFLLSRFVNSSYEVLIYRDRRFSVILMYECCFIVLFSLSIGLFKAQMAVDFSYFLWLLIGFDLLRMLAYSLILKLRLRSGYHLVLMYADLKAAFPFFLNALIGFFGSRGDSLLAMFCFNNSQLAAYQIAFNFVFLFQALCNFIFYTYSSHFYRLSAPVKAGIIKKYTLLGVAVSCFFFVMVAMAFRFWYHIDLAWPVYILLSLFILLSFVHQPYIYLIYQQKKVNIISVTGLLSIGVFLLSLILFNNVSSDTLFYNFVISALIAHAFRTVVFYVAGKKYLRETYHLSYKTPEAG